MAFVAYKKSKKVVELKEMVSKIYYCDLFGFIIKEELQNSMFFSW